jgi:hypothetical protein
MDCWTSSRRRGVQDPEDRYVLQPRILDSICNLYMQPECKIRLYHSLKIVVKRQAALELGSNLAALSMYLPRRSKFLENAIVIADVEHQ